jgi:hypothetical protein
MAWSDLVEDVAAKAATAEGILGRLDQTAACLVAAPLGGDHLEAGLVVE